MIVVLMGVSGSGKTTIGAALAARLHWAFADADEFHSAQNKQKMAAGIALTDGERAPWLKNLQQQVSDWLEAQQSAALACSALKQSYREALMIHPDVRLVHLKGSYDVIAPRIRERVSHYATELLLSSQFATLEEPRDALAIDINRSVPEILDEICLRLNLAAGSHAR